MTLVYFAELLTLILAVAAIALIFVRDLFSAIALMAVYSGLLATMFAIMGSVDVAFMEVVVGTSLSTVFLMALMWWIDPDELSRFRPARRLVAAVPALGIGGLLLWGVHALPDFGDPSAPATLHVSPEYAARAYTDMATPNVVAAVLADYRSFDTMIESAVVLTAVLACLLVLMYRDDPTV